MPLSVDVLDENLYMNTHSTHFDPNVGGSMYLRKVGNTSTQCKALRGGSTSTVNHLESLK
jgi:hypothetical protein